MKNIEVGAGFKPARIPYVFFPHYFNFASLTSIILYQHSTSAADNLGKILRLPWRQGRHKLGLCTFHPADASLPWRQARDGGYIPYIYRVFTKP